MKLPTNEGPRVDEVGGFIVPSSAGSTGTANRCNQERKRVLHRFDAPVQRSLVSKSDRTTSISSRRRGRKRSQPEGQELTAMDYSLPAVKMHIAQLKPAKPAKELRPNGGVAFTLGSLVFQRAWLQVFRFLFSLRDEIIFIVPMCNLRALRGFVFGTECSL